MRFLTLLLASLWLASLTGCSVESTASRWITRQGGVATDQAHQRRADSILARLTGGHPELNATVRVLNSDAVCAYGLPNRTLFVTRGLLEHTDDNVIGAALAHEFGHLFGDGHVQAVVSLKGCNQDLSAEGRADAYGVELLRLQHLPPESMIRMLCIVRDSNALSSHRVKAMNQRIKWLNGRISK